jgi:ubiquinone/menaquinone biosynthesis C-methylase UbiE
VKLNWIETIVMNNPVRAHLQKRREAPALTALAPRPLEGADALVVGCGRGVDIEIAFEMILAARVTAIDLDERQVTRARARLARKIWGDRLRLEVGDVSAMPFAGASFDLVLDFGIIHHVPVWQEAVGEISRVLRPGGQFLFEEIPKHVLDSPLARVLTRHPREDRFDGAGFRAECERRGLDIGERFENFRILVFDAFRGAAVKAE